MLDIPEKSQRVWKRSINETKYNMNNTLKWPCPWRLVPKSKSDRFPSAMVVVQWCFHWLLDHLFFSPSVYLPQTTRLLNCTLAITKQGNAPRVCVCVCVCISVWIQVNVALNSALTRESGSLSSFPLSSRTIIISQHSNNMYFCERAWTWRSPLQIAAAVRLINKNEDKSTFNS